MNKDKKILINGSGGFIGAALALKLVSEGYLVIGIDNLNNYYEKKLKLGRLELIKRSKNSNLYKFYEKDITDEEILEEIFVKYEPEIVVNLAAQAGVRYSMLNPKAYVKTNLSGFANILECCRNHEVKNFI